MAPTNVELAQRMARMEELAKAAAEEHRAKDIRRDAQIEHLTSEVARLTRALLGEPGDTEPAFMSRALDVIVAWERSGWLVRSGKTLLLSLGALAAAYTAIRASAPDWWPFKH